MSATRPRPTVRACVDCELRVPRGGPGDLVEGVTALLERVAEVHEASVREVETVRPSPLDIYVTARVAVALDPVHEDPAGVRQTLTDGFGVLAVEDVTIERAPDRA